MSPVATTEPAAEAAIIAAARELQLPTIRTEAARLADQAAKDQLTHRGFLAEVLTAEVDDRSSRHRARRVVEARFPRLKHLNEFDTTASPVDPATTATLTAGAWIDRGEPVVLIGDSGTGKTHLLLIGAGMAAAQAGRRVRYITCPRLVNELAEAADENTLSKLVGRYGRLDLLCLDELGYVHIDDRGAELLFQVITERDEAGSIAIASNHPFSEWGHTFTDLRLAAAVVDRVTYHAHIIETGTDSDRLRATRAARTNSGSTATATTHPQQSSKQPSMLPNRPTPPGLESNSPSLHQTQGDSNQRRTEGGIFADHVAIGALPADPVDVAEGPVPGTTPKVSPWLTETSR